MTSQQVLERDYQVVVGTNIECDVRLNEDLHHVVE